MKHVIFASILMIFAVAGVAAADIPNGGGLSLGRPYSGGTFSVADNGSFAFTLSRPDHPADVAVGRRGARIERLTRLNEDLLGHKELAAVEEIRFESSFDGREKVAHILKWFEIYRNPED